MAGNVGGDMEDFVALFQREFGDLHFGILFMVLAVWEPRICTPTGLFGSTKC